MTVQYKVVDSDQHVNPPAEFWAEYLPAKFRDRAPVVEETDEGRFFVFEGKRKKLSGLGAMAGRNAKDYKVDHAANDINRKTDLAGSDAGVRLEEMVRDGIDAAVMFGGGPLGTMDPELFIESFAAYNRWLADFCSTAPQQLFGIAYVPMLAYDVEHSTGLLRQYAAMGFRGVNIPAFPVTRRAIEALGSATFAGPMLGVTGDPASEIRYDDPLFDPFWAAAAELQMPITIHLGARPVRLEPKLFLSDLLMSKLAMAEPVAIAIYGGVFERHPELKFVTVEAGVGWFSFAADYMDRTWEKQRFWTGNDLPHPPSHYFARNIYGTFIHDSAGIRNREQLGGGNIMWSSDYPHSETTYPRSHEWIDRLFADVPAADRQAIICDRAREVFRI